MNEQKNVVPFKQQKESVTRKTILTAIPVRAEIDPKDARNCLSASWENEVVDLFFEGNDRKAPERCPGMGTVLDSGDLVCEYFIRANPAAFAPLEIKSDAMLYAPNGEIAQWGTENPVRRCAPC